MLTSLAFDPDAFDTNAIATDSPYCEFAPRFLESGYVVVPCRPGSKVPGTYRPSGWHNMYDWAGRWAERMPTESEVGAWSVWPDMPGLCLITGHAGGAADGIAALDNDAIDRRVFQAIQSCMPDSPVGKRGAKGETVFARIPAGVEFPSKPFNLKGIRVLDVLAGGRQTVVPPTQHPDTCLPYVWSRGPALYEVPVQDLPPIDATFFEAIEEALRPFGYSGEESVQARMAARVVRTSDGGLTPHRDLNEHALANLGAWVPSLGLYRLKETRLGFAAVTIWEPNAKGISPDKRGLSLSIHPDGIRDMSRDRGYTPIDLVMRSQGCDLDTAFTFLARRTGWIGDVPDMPLPPPIETRVAPIPVAAPPELLREPEPVIEDLPEPLRGLDDPQPEQPVQQAQPGAGTPDITRPPGLIGRIVDWIEASAESPSRDIALGSAILVCGTLIGRRYIGPTGSATHLYGIMVGPTASGKDYPLSAANRLMKAAGADCHVGPDDYMSFSAFISACHEQPLHLALIDELGASIRRMNDARASTHEQMLTKAIRTAWGRSFEEYKSPSWAGKKSIRIQAPAISILGASTVDELMDAFSVQSKGNGLLNRFTFFQMQGRPYDRKPTVGRDVPDDIAQACRDLFCSQGEPATHQLFDPELLCEPQVVPWADDKAEAMWRALKGRCVDLMRGDEEMEAFLGRTAEMALRMATILAVTLDPHDPTITEEAVRWGEAVALASARIVHKEGQERIGATDTMRATAQIIKVLRAAPDGMTHRDLHRKVGGRFPSRVFKELLSALITDSERVKQEKRIDPDTGDVKVVYTLAQN